MAVITSILNGTNLNRDHDFSSIISGVEKTGVRTGFGNELAVTAGQVDTGMAFISVKRTNVTPNEIFTIPVWVTSAVTGLDTTTIGNFIIIELDQAKINDGSSNAVDGSGIATVKSVAVLPTENFIELAEITAGPVITDKRSFATIKDNQVPNLWNWAVDSGIADAYIVSIPSAPKSYFDGMVVRFKALNLNTGASTINVNGLGVVPITRNHNIVLSGGDIKADQNVELVYNSDLVGFEMISQVGTGAASDELVKSSATDTTADFLNNKVVVGLGITKITINPSGNEQISMSTEPDPALFGTQIDGDVVISVNTTLSSDKNYKKLTINSGVSLDTNGYKVYAEELVGIDATSIIKNSGGNATGGSAGATGGGVTLPDGQPAGNGGSGGTPLTVGSPGGVGTNAETGNNLKTASIAGFGDGGKGGNSVGSNAKAGGIGGLTGSKNAQNRIIDLTRNIIFSDFLIDFDSSRLVAMPGGGGGGGGGGGSASGGNGGGCGGSAGIVWVSARTISGVLTFEAKGGQGGDGSNGQSGNPTASGGGGSGSGGHGGFIIRRFKVNTATIVDDVSGGLPGTPGLGFVGSSNTGQDGTTGENGSDGQVYDIQI